MNPQKNLQRRVIQNDLRDNMLIKCKSIIDSIIAREYPRLITEVCFSRLRYDAIFNDVDKQRLDKLAETRARINNLGLNDRILKNQKHTTTSNNLTVAGRLWKITIVCVGTALHPEGSIGLNFRSIQSWQR